SLHYYQVGPVFNFYNGTTFRGRAVRLPRDPKYLAKYLLGLTNIPCDADTTSVSMLAKVRWDESFEVPEETFASLSQHRDIRRSPHYHNWLLGHVNTHAFLTSQWDEKNELSLLAPPDAGTRIPLSRNDVDCVVNANVMALLGATGKTELPGYKESCNYLNSI